MGSDQSGAGYLVKLTFEDPRMSSHREIKSEKHEIELLLENEDRDLPVIVRRFHAVLRVYSCEGFLPLNLIIREALMQVRLTSDYTCQLTDISIRQASRSLFKVGLTTEILEEVLEKDIKRRVLHDNLYEETELRHILECVAEAMMHVKTQVRCI